MTRLCFCISFIYSLALFAQTDPNVILVDISEFKQKFGLNRALKNTLPFAQEAETTVDIKKSYWDHTVYNPYQNLHLQYPIEISFGDSTYHPPIKKTKIITSRYGWRHGRAHNGIDIDLEIGDSLYSMFDGIVRMSRYSRGHGRTVVIRHYNGLETVYAHLSEYAVKENDSLKKGQYIGKGGISGNARGSHLHLAVNFKGVPINPEYLFNFNKYNIIRAKRLYVTKRWTRPIYHDSKRQTDITLLLSREDAVASLNKRRSIYVVKSGDTLSQISRGNNVSITAICKTNTIDRNAVLKIGQQLIIEK